MTTMSAQRGMIVTEWRAFEKNTLKAFVELTLPSKLIIRGCSYHVKSDSRWIGLPAKQIVKDGEMTWVPIICFADKEARKRFQRGAIDAIDRYLSQNGGGQ